MRRKTSEVTHLPVTLGSFAKARPNIGSLIDHFLNESLLAFFIDVV